MKHHNLHPNKETSNMEQISLDSSLSFSQQNKFQVRPDVRYFRKKDRSQLDTPSTMHQFQKTHTFNITSKNQIQQQQNLANNVETKTILKEDDTEKTTKILSLKQIKQIERNSIEKLKNKNSHRQGQSQKIFVSISKFNSRMSEQKGQKDLTSLKQKSLGIKDLKMQNKQKIKLLMYSDLKNELRNRKE